jgi:ParB family chromosome partitioning protein
MVSKKSLFEANKAPDVLGASQIPLDLIIEDATQLEKYLIRYHWQN